MKKPILFSFFSGSGFLDLGFEMNGFDVQYVNEYHKPFLSAYKYSREKLNIKKPKYGFDDRSIEELVHGNAAFELQDKVLDAKKSGSLLGFIGGPPCPDFSVGGKNRGSEGDNGKLTKVYVEGIIKFLPDFFIFENVKGLWRTKRHREFYEEMKSKLTDAGYILADRLTNSIEFGVPQDRDRIILFGIKKGLTQSQSNGCLLNDLNWPEYIIFDKKQLLEDTAWPSQDAYQENSTTEIPSEVKTLKELTIQHWFEKNEVDSHPNSKDFFTPRAALVRFQTINEGDVTKKSFKRLHRWRYSPTAAYGNNEVHIHPYFSRRISAAEALAIQSLPKEFQLPSEMSLSNMFKTIGNGVPFLLSSGVAKMIKDYLKMNTNLTK